MKLRRPTDFLILQGLHSHGRNVATNLAELTGKSRKNLNSRLPVLADYGLVEKVGPAETSGLYEITPLGRRALRYADRYDEVADFEALIRSPPTDSTSDTTNPILRGGRQSDEDAS